MTNIFDECSLPQFLNNCFYSIFLFYTVHISKRFLEDRCFEIENYVQNRIEKFQYKIQDITFILFLYIKWSWINFIRCFHNIEIEIWTFYTIKISRKMECIMCIQVCLFAHSRFGFIFSIYSLHFSLVFLYFSSKKEYFFCIYYWAFFNRVSTILISVFL